MKTKDFHVPVSPCTNCGKPNDGALSVGNDDAPEPGDITICIECQHVMAFADDLTLRDLTDEEMHMVAGDPKLIWAQQVLAEYKAEKN